MSIYKNFSYSQLKTVSNQNPNDTEAKKRLSEIEEKALKSNDFNFYLSFILIATALFMAYTKTGPMPLSYIPIGLLGVSLSILNIDNYLLKRQLKKNNLG